MSQDHLGSIQKFYPYGEIRVGAAGPPMFATYQRVDSVGGTLDYAVNRFYSWQLGRSMTPDPYRGSASRRNPSSWNRYAYVLDDPVNISDPDGQRPCRSWWDCAQRGLQVGGGVLQIVGGTFGLVAAAGAEVGTGGAGTVFVGIALV